MHSSRFVFLAAAAAVAAASSHAGATSERRRHPQPAQGAPANPERTEPDMLRPLRWMIAAQNDDGSWGETARSPTPDIATTALSGLALLRLGHTGSGGVHQANTRRAVEFIAGAVEKTPKDEVAINAAGTLPQRKLGRNIDTFIAAQFLAEVLPTLPRGKLHARAEAALASCVHRIEKAQSADGSYAKDGWAPLLASAFASNGLYAARRSGATVSEKTLSKGQENLVGKYDEAKKEFSTSDAAGVSLYSVAASTMAAQQLAAAPPAATPEGRAAQKHARTASAAGAAALSNENVMRGFGTYGGEEHVSYMLTAEAKAALGGAEWVEFRKSMRARLAQIQREDGTWRGDHCITSTTFCTAASLITLAVEAKARGRAS
jgi:hypothetical protein